MIDILDKIQHLVAEELDDARVVLVSSAPGIGRNHFLHAALDEHFPGEFHHLDAVTPRINDTLLSQEMFLRRARVVLIEGLAFAPRDAQRQIMTLVLTGHTEPLPVKYQPSRSITLRDDVVFMISEQTEFADRIQKTYESLLPSGHLRRIDL